MRKARFDRTVTDAQGNTIAGASVEVRDHRTGDLAQLFSDRTGLTGISNPTTTDSNGNYGFFIAGGPYRIRAYTGPSAAPTFENIKTYVGIGTAQELDEESVVFGEFDGYDLTANQSDYNAEEEGFRLWLVDAFDGDGGWVVRDDDAPGDWYGPFTNRGPRGGDRYDLLFYDPDQPVDGEVLLEAPFTTEVTFPAGLAQSKAKASVAPAANAVFSIRKNGVQFATCTFAASSTTGVFSCPTSTTFNPDTDDELSIVGPNPADAQLRRPRITISGFRPT